MEQIVVEFNLNILKTLSQESSLTLMKHDLRLCENKTKIAKFLVNMSMSDATIKLTRSISIMISVLIIKQLYINNDRVG